MVPVPSLSDVPHNQHCPTTAVITEQKINVKWCFQLTTRSLIRLIDNGELLTVAECTWRSWWCQAATGNKAESASTVKPSLTDICTVKTSHSHQASLCALQLICWNSWYPAANLLGLPYVVVEGPYVSELFLHASFFFIFHFSSKTGQQTNKRKIRGREGRMTLT